MQKTQFIVLLLIGLVIIGSACDNQKTPQELLKEENKAIDRFIHKNGFIILSQYPENGKFNEKEFYKDATGLYIHVINQGDSTRAKTNQTILGRYYGLLSFKDDTIPSMTISQPDEFIYGRGTFSGAACLAWEYALQYVGDESEVRLIVPSKIGTYSDMINYKPVYYKSLKFSIY